MKTLEECKDEAAKSITGVATWLEFLKSPFWHRFQHDVADKAAELYADQFKPKWIPVEDMTKDTPDAILMLFDNGSVRRHEEDWPFAIATHFFVLPSAPERKEEGE